MVPKYVKGCGCIVILTASKGMIAYETREIERYGIELTLDQIATNPTIADDDTIDMYRSEDSTEPIYSETIRKFRRDMEKWTETGETKDRPITVYSIAVKQGKSIYVNVPANVVRWLGISPGDMLKVTIKK